MRNHIIIKSKKPSKINKIINDARLFLSSEEGRKQIEEALKKARKTIEEFKASKIDPAILHIPMDI